MNESRHDRWDPLQKARDAITEHPDIHTWDMMILETDGNRIVSPIIGHESASVQDLFRLLRRTAEGKPTRGGWMALHLPVAGGDLWVHHTPASSMVAHRLPGKAPVPVQPGNPLLRELPAASRCKCVQSMLDGVIVMDSADANRQVRMALQAVPGYEPALKLQARLHQLEGRQEDALAILENLARGRRDAEAWYMLADTLDGLGRPEDALAAYNAAVEINPGYVEVWGDRGMLLKRMGREQEAFASYEAVLRLDPGNPTTRLNLAIAHFNAGRLAQVGQHLAAMDPERTNPNMDATARSLASELQRAGRG